MPPSIWTNEEKTNLISEVHQTSIQMGIIKNCFETDHILVTAHQEAIKGNGKDGLEKGLERVQILQETQVLPVVDLVKGKDGKPGLERRTESLESRIRMFFVIGGGVFAFVSGVLVIVVAELVNNLAKVMTILAGLKTTSGK